jgi:hypothetical protein
VLKQGSKLRESVGICRLTAEASVIASSRHGASPAATHTHTHTHTNYAVLWCAPQSGLPGRQDKHTCAAVKWELDHLAEPPPHRQPQKQ